MTPPGPASKGGPRVLEARLAEVGSAAVVEAAAHLRAGRVLAYPTETTYGFGGLCTERAIARVRALKGRDADKPLLVLVRSAEEVSKLRWTDEARALSRIFWPGAVTLVLSDPLATFPTGVRSPAGAVAVRVSPHPLVTAILESVDAPITSTSAKPPGGTPARTGDEARLAVSSLDGGREVLVLDGGALPHSAPSTVVDCTAAEPVVLREGSVPLSRLRCAIPELHGD